MMSNENQTETTEETKTSETSTTNTEETTETKTSSEESESESESKSFISNGETKTETEDTAPITAADLKFPEGFEIDESAQKQFVDIMNEDLTRAELANKLVTFQSTMAQAASDSISGSWDDMVTQWQTAAEAHPDIGGDKLKPALGAVKNLINEVMGDKANEVFDAFDLTGIGNNPDVISLLHKLASERAEGKLTAGERAAPATTLAQQMFPDQGKK